MRAARILCLILSICVLFLRSVIAADISNDTHEPYRLAKTLSIGGDGGWDYLTVDSRSKLLYVPRSTHTRW